MCTLMAGTALDNAILEVGELKKILVSKVIEITGAVNAPTSSICQTNQLMMVPQATAAANNNAVLVPVRA